MVSAAAGGNGVLNDGQCWGQGPDPVDPSEGCSCSTPGPQRTRELTILGPPPAHATIGPVHHSPTTSIQTRVDYSINSFIKLIAILMPLLSLPSQLFILTESYQHWLCIKERCGEKLLIWKRKWICSWSAHLGFKTSKIYLNMFSFALGSLICFYVHEKLSCKSSSFWSVGHRKINGNEVIFSSMFSPNLILFANEEVHWGEGITG